MVMAKRKSYFADIHVKVTEEDNAQLQKIRDHLRKIGVEANATDAVRYALRVALKDGK
jgi:hypothetical protein